MLGVGSLCHPTVTLAQDTTWYQIEVVVFAHPDSAGAASEVWPTNSSESGVESPIELLSSNSTLNVDTEAADARAPGESSTAEAPLDEIAPLDAPADAESLQTLDANESIGLRAFVRLPDEELQLTNLRQRLDNSPGYRTLAHLGWRQPLTRNKKAHPVHIHSNSKRQSTPTMVVPASIPDTASDSDAGVASAPQTPLHILDGTVAVALSRYLHVGMDLIYAPDPPPVIAIESPTPADATTPTINAPVEAIPEIGGPNLQTSHPAAVPVYRMNQSRRMRSNELHYVDHPLLGVLVQATPVKVGNP